MMRKIFVDTGGWYAAAASRDRDHEAAKQFLATNHLPLVTSDYVLDETVTLLKSRLGHIYAVKFLDALQASKQVELVQLTAAHLAETINLFRSRPDKGWSFTDCSSFVLCGSRALNALLPLTSIFSRLGFNCCPFSHQKDEYPFQFVSSNLFVSG